MLHAAGRIRSPPHVAYTDHINASRGIVVFYGEPRPDFSSLREPYAAGPPPDKRCPRYPRDFLINDMRFHLHRSPGLFISGNKIGQGVRDGASE